MKNLVIGRVGQTSSGPKAKALTYHARLAEAERFTQESRLEFWRRGTENARRVVAVSDGAEWIGPFLDEQCPEALRIIEGERRRAPRELYTQFTSEECYDFPVWLILSSQGAELSDGAGA